MRTIYKYPLTLVDEQMVTVPFSFALRHVGKDPSGQLCIWGEVDTSREGEMDIKIHIRGEGHEIPELALYHGTVCDGPFMWHVFTDLNSYVHRK